MKSLTVILLLLGTLAGACSRRPTVATASERLAKATSPLERFWALPRAAKESFEEGRIEEARTRATQLLTLVPDYPQDWNLGNAIHDGNLVLGRIALREGRREDAKRHLLEAGRSSGSPQLNSFGPSMTLARDLVEKSEREVVLEYFDLIRRFWKNGGDELDRWSRELKAGTTPDFGSNLKF